MRIKREDGEVTASDFDWIGQPFKAPIYYGARVWRWNPLGRFGTMVDFTHAKAIAKPDSVAKFTGSHNGQALPRRAPMKDVFSKLEFSHGHNMLTYNGLFRLGSLFGWLRPYVGAGAGVSLPHSEIGYAKENVRTYEYHFAGFAGQGLAGVEIDLGQTSLFSSTSLPTRRMTSRSVTSRPVICLVTDLWRQFSAWWRGEKAAGWTAERQPCLASRHCRRDGQDWAIGRRRHTIVDPVKSSGSISASKMDGRVRSSGSGS